MNEFLLALTATFTSRLRAMLRNPIRRRHFATQIATVWLANFAVTLSWWRASLATALEFAIYEFVLEPLTRLVMRKRAEVLKAHQDPYRLAAYTPMSAFERLLAWLGRFSWCGPYWERGPRDGETYGSDD